MSPLGCLLLPAVAVAAAVARWLVQARGNLYTDLATRYYVPDRDIEWRAVENGPVSLGLDAVAVLCGYALALGALLLLVRRWERRRGRSLPRALPWLAAAFPLLLPAWAFATGSVPAGAAERPPAGLIEAPVESITAGLAGLPPGTYRVAPHAGTAIRARVAGGGETFDARFARDIEGSWRGAPADLRQPMSADISVAAAAVDTGIELRSTHAREEYLDAGHHPRIRFHLDRVLAAAPAAGGSIAYRAAGTVELMGRRHPVSVTGTLRAPDPAARARMGFAPGDAVLRATATFPLQISRTALASSAKDFDGDFIPIEVSLVLRREAERGR
jgi:hypothetical protein